MLTIAARGRQICHRLRSFGRGYRRPRAHPHPHGWALVRPASPPSVDYLRLWCFANNLAEANHIVLHKAQGSQGFDCFRGRTSLVLIGWPAFGMMAESYGFALLFSFWPTAAVYLQKKLHHRLDFPAPLCDICKIIFAALLLLSCVNFLQVQPSLVATSFT